MDSITPNLWFDGDAEEAAEFYVSLFPDSRIDKIVRSPADNPSTAKDEVVVVEFTLAGRAFTGINGGPQYNFTEAVSFAIECDDQAELDLYWQALTADGGSAGQCGWCKDRFGLSWQVTPKRPRELLDSPYRQAAERTMLAMLDRVKIETDELERAFRGE